MVKREFWIVRIEQAWRERSVVWLSGVRRVGKTFLCRSLADVEYFDCELPRVRHVLEDPEAFLAEMRGRRVVLDEIHRLANPSELLKIAADHYPDVRVIATGSSTLGASARFRDTLTGRKTGLRLTPMIEADLHAFGRTDLRHRFLHGGLVPFFMADELPEADFQDWIESYWAKDVQELFRVERRRSFMKFAELLMVQSGGIFEASSFAAPCEVGRTTIANYLRALEETFVVHVLRPFSSRRATEIVAAPKVYAFDTGFVCFAKGVQTLRAEDLGLLWEHFVLNEIQANLQSARVGYWRDKQKHEVDFVIAPRGRAPIAIECSWARAQFDPTNLAAFRRAYPEGENLVAAHDVDRPHERRYKDVTVRFVNLPALVERIAPASRRGGPAFDT